MRRYLKGVLYSILPWYFITEPRLKLDKSSKVKLSFVAFVDFDYPPNLLYWRILIGDKPDCEKIVVIDRYEFRRTNLHTYYVLCGRNGGQYEFVEK